MRFCSKKVKKKGNISPFQTGVFKTTANANQTQNIADSLHIRIGADFKINEREHRKLNHQRPD
jgi:hypothetical protein